MAKKRKTKQRTSDYKPAFTDAEYKLMQNYGVGNLLDEIGINRVMLLRTMDKMNEDRKQLTFRDHLDALRAVSYSTGRIASLLEIREELYKPYQEVENHYREGIEQVEELIEKVGVTICGKKEWEKVHLDAMRQIMMDEAASPKSIKSNQSKRKESR
jgi:hypothetical protein